VDGRRSWVPAGEFCKSTPGDITHREIVSYLPAAIMRCNPLYGARETQPTPLLGYQCAPRSSLCASVGARHETPAHGDFVCISDRIFRLFEIVLPPESRLEILKDALLEVIRLEPEDPEGLNPYEVEDFVDALERTRQKVLGGDDRP